MDGLSMLWTKGELLRMPQNPSVPSCWWVLLLKLLSFSWPIQVAFSIQFFPSTYYTCFKITLLQTTITVNLLFPTSLAADSYLCFILQQKFHKRVSILIDFTLLFLFGKMCEGFFFSFFESRTIFLKHQWTGIMMTVFWFLDQLITGSGCF